MPYNNANHLVFLPFLFKLWVSSLLRDLNKIEREIKNKLKNSMLNSIRNHGGDLSSGFKPIK